MLEAEECAPLGPMLSVGPYQTKDLKVQNQHFLRVEDAESTSTIPLLNFVLQDTLAFLLSPKPLVHRCALSWYLKPLPPHLLVFHIIHQLNSSRAQSLKPNTWNINIAFCCWLVLGLAPTAATAWSTAAAGAGAGCSAAAAGGANDSISQSCFEDVQALASARVGKRCVQHSDCRRHLLGHLVQEEGLEVLLT
jgi:hypothetical protein